MEPVYPVLFEQVKIKNCVIKNRFAMAPMGPLGLGDSCGGFNQRGIDYYTARARGGVGLIITGCTPVDNHVELHNMPNFPCSTHDAVHFTRTSREMTERVHAYGAKIFLQMTAGFGRVAIPTNIGKTLSVSASAIPHRWLDEECRPLTVEEIHEIVKRFGEGAYNAMRGGFDGVQIHAVHEGYLLDQFAVAFFNRRTDEYGGSLENRLRFAKEIVEEIKKTCGPDFPVTLRYSPKSFIKDWREGALPGESFTEKGRDLEEGVEAARLLESYGYDALDVDVGSYDAWWWSHPPMYQEKGLYRPYAQLIKDHVQIPVICAGRMDDPEMATAAIQDGVCDLIGLGRPLLADQDYVNKLRMGDLASIRPCLSCQEGCMGRIQAYSQLCCAVNPSACREEINRLVPAAHPKKVLIIGGGVAGCEAARVLALRGHIPCIYEKSGQLGGNLLAGGVPHFKEDDLKLSAWYTHALKQLSVEVHLNQALTAEEIMAANADAVIIATGSAPNTFPLGEQANVCTASQALLSEVKVGKKAVVVGGGLVGCETAIWLAEQGVETSLVEQMDSLLAVNAPLCSANKDMLMRLVPYRGVKVYTSSKILSADGESAVIQTPDGQCTVPCDTVVLAVGYHSENALYQALDGRIPNLYLVGDAHRVANIMYAIWDAFEIASHLE